MVRVAADLASWVTLALSNEFCIVIFFCGYIFVCVCVRERTTVVTEKLNELKFAILVNLYSVYCLRNSFRFRVSVKSCN